MEDMYSFDSNNNTNAYTCSASSGPPRDDHHRSSDEISLFLHQILLRSSSPSTSSSCSSFVASAGPPMGSCSAPLSIPRDDHHLRSLRSLPFVKDGILGVDSCDQGVNGGYLSGNVSGSSAANVSSSSVGGGSENDNDDCDCESEEGLEALMDEVTAKPAAPRSSSKRSRAAEVHNLSEKRRRSRINEKMKALQNLIPNSNKTDKASMLDEAIEYLKQLQLQVQMLSMRNGISLHPMCLPGMLQPFQLSQLRMGFGEENGSQHMNMTGALPLNQEASAQTMFSPPNQCTSSNQLLVPNMSHMMNSESSFGLESSIQAHFGPFPLHASSEGICRQNVLPNQQLNVNHSERNSVGFEMGDTATVSLLFGTQPSNLKDNISPEARMIGRDQTEGVLSKNIECNLILSPNLNSMQTGRSAPSGEVKMERRAI